MRDQGNQAVGGEDGRDAAEEEQRVGGVAVCVVSDLAAGSDDFVRGGEFG